MDCGIINFEMCRSSRRPNEITSYKPPVDPEQEINDRLNNTYESRIVVERGNPPVIRITNFSQKGKELLHYQTNDPRAIRRMTKTSKIVHIEFADDPCGEYSAHF
ncbi:MAG: hypothetical protein J7K72_02250 [Candidatus Aenigmarchaeota archaeon]|nr:hypothetical protein [Candidatus Aenigmarchaeota archaeon]